MFVKHNQYLDKIISEINNHPEIVKENYNFSVSTNIDRENSCATYIVRLNGNHLFGVNYNLQSRNGHNIKYLQYPDYMIEETMAEDLIKLIFANGLLRAIDVINKTHNVIVNKILDERQKDDSIKKDWGIDENN